MVKQESNHKNYLVSTDSQEYLVDSYEDAEELSIKLASAMSEGLGPDMWKMCHESIDIFPINGGY